MKVYHFRTLGWTEVWGYGKTPSEAEAAGRKAWLEFRRDLKEDGFEVHEEHWSSWDKYKEYSGTQLQECELGKGCIAQ